MRTWAAAVAIALTGVCAVDPVGAQTMLQIRVVPAKPKAGEVATLAGRFGPGAAAPNCNVRVDFGDDTPLQDVLIKDATELPLMLAHVFAQGGDYVVSVQPVPNGKVPACGGGNHSTLIEVQAP
ncbi:MAG: hypothetical protein Q7T97_17555 [Burkholderiaceae bacterium]|nr:hypothetical protein [Burkholderiaceae bacterium]